MRDSYYFDKRKMKRIFGKYGIIFLLSFAPVILLNMYAFKNIAERWLVIFIDSVIILIFVVIGNAIATKIFDKKDKELERRQKERRELQEKKKKIMEDSYKRIRDEKTTKKASQSKQKDEIVIEVEDNVKTTETPKKQPSKQTKNTNSKINKNTKGRK